MIWNQLRRRKWWSVFQTMTSYTTKINMTKRRWRLIRSFIKSMYSMSMKIKWRRFWASTHQEMARTVTPSIHTIQSQNLVTLPHVAISLKNRKTSKTGTQYRHSMISTKPLYNQAAQGRSQFQNRYRSRGILRDHRSKVDLSFLNFQDNHEAKGRIIREGPKWIRL